MAPSQIPLELQIEKDASFESFYAGENSALIDTLSTIASSSERRSLMLLTSQGRLGKSHLLQATANRANDLGRSAIYLSLKDLADFLEASNELPAELVEMAMQQEIVCLDDLQIVPRVTPPLRNILERFCFVVINEQILHSAYSLVIGCSEAIEGLQFDLADLHSRLSLARHYQIARMDDRSLTRLLQFRSERLGLEMNDDVADFLLRRCARNPASLVAALDALDRYSMAQSRRLTIPLVKQALDL